MKVMQLNLSYVLCFFSFLFCGLVFNGFGLLSPIYFSYLCQICFPMFFWKYIKLSFLKILFVVFFAISYYFCLLFVHTSSNMLAGIQIIFSLLTFILANLMFSLLRKNMINKIAIIFIKFSVCILLFEMITRLLMFNDFSFPLLGSSLFYNERLFYKYKENSIMGTDSNFICTYALVVYFFNLYLIKRKKSNLHYLRFLLLVEIFFTFSRSGWIAFILGEIILRILFVGRKNNFRFRNMFYIILCLCGVVAIFSNFLFGDSSFLLRVDVYGKTVRFIEESSIFNKLFGLGYLNSQSYIGRIVAHNLYSTLIIDTGLFGFFIYMTIWLGLSVESRGYGLYIIIPIAIFAVMFIQQLIPFFYMSIAAILHLEKDEE